MTLEEIKTAITHRDYNRAVEMASTAFDSQHQQWDAILDYRSYALGMQGKFDHAVRDAQDIIASRPTMARGYIRLGRLYEMQGRQLDAIEIYNIGLQTVPADSEHYSLIKSGKASATRHNERRVDFIARLPAKIADEVITRLPEESKLICLREISREWRKRFRKCTKAWTILSLIDPIDYSRRSLGSSIITIHVEDLTIDTPNMESWKKYMVNLRNGRFRNIKTLRLKPTSAKLINMHTVMLVTNALCQINTTLTTLVLHHNVKRVTLVLSELLFALSNLRHIVYTTTQPLSNVTGHFSPSKPHNALIDMQLKSSPIEGHTIAPLLRYCRKLRRLVLDGCKATVLDIVNTACPGLEIFGYNSEDLVIPTVDYSADNISTGVLREFYTRKKPRPESASVVLPLIRRNMKTLTKISMEIAYRGFDDLDAMYPDLKLEGLSSLTLWGDDSSKIQSLLLRSTCNCTALTHLSAMGSRDIPGLVNTLVSMPQITSLELAYVRNISESASLVRLLETYARGSQFPQTCESLTFKCFTLTDECIAALAKISTLKSITLEDLQDSISPIAIDNFFDSLVQSNIVHAHFGGMDCVTDRHIGILGDMRNLKSLYLNSLKNVTDDGVMAMADKKPELQRFIITNCDGITRKPYMQIRKNIKYAVIKLN